MEDTSKFVIVERSLMQSVANYLGSRPFAEVVDLIPKLHMQVVSLTPDVFKQDVDPAAKEAVSSR